MKVIGITGGVGSGKSQILHYLEENYDAFVCQMDDTARVLQRKGTDCFRKIIHAFGVEMIGPDGELNRGKLAALVFKNPDSLQKLNDIVHPEVLAYVKRDMEEKLRQGVKLYVVESALLPDVGRELCDEIWYIRVEETVRRDRLKSSRGYTDERITEMIASQPPESRFLDICSVVIDNTGTFENTKRQIGDRL